MNTIEEAHTIDLLSIQIDNYETIFSGTYEIVSMETRAELLDKPILRIATAVYGLWQSTNWGSLRKMNFLLTLCFCDYNCNIICLIGAGTYQLSVLLS